MVAIKTWIHVGRANIDPNNCSLLHYYLSSSKNRTHHKPMKFYTVYIFGKRDKKLKWIKTENCLLCPCGILADPYCVNEQCILVQMAAVTWLKYYRFHVKKKLYNQSNNSTSSDFLPLYQRLCEKATNYQSILSFLRYPMSQN